MEEKVAALRFFSSFLPSFLSTAQQPRNSTDRFPCTFEFWIGYDLGDPVLDTAEGRALFQAHFKSAATDFEAQAFCGRGDRAACVSVTMLPFNYTNTLTALWNGLNAAAYRVRPTPPRPARRRAL